MRIGAAVGVVLSTLLALVGIGVAVAAAGTDVAFFGWVVAAVGVLFAAANLVLYDRTRR